MNIDVHYPWQPRHGPPGPHTADDNYNVSLQVAILNTKERSTDMTTELLVCDKDEDDGSRVLTLCPDALTGPSFLLFTKLSKEATVSITVTPTRQAGSENSSLPKAWQESGLGFWAVCLQHQQHSKLLPCIKKTTPTSIHSDYLKATPLPKGTRKDAPCH